MDMPNVDLYQRLLIRQLERPAIVVQVKPAGNLERIVAGSSQGRRMLLISSKAVNKNFLKELHKPFIIKDFFYEESDTHYKFVLDPKDQSLVAGILYYIDKNNQKRLNMMVYFKKDELPFVFIYKPGADESNWRTLKKISYIFMDTNKNFTSQIEQMYEHYKRIEEIRQQRQQDEGVVMLV